MTHGMHSILGVHTLKSKQSGCYGSTLNMHVIEHTYVSLLADVAHLSGFSEIRGSYEGLQWCLNEAPKLEKLVLHALETNESLDLEAFPTWLRRLVAASLQGDAVRLRLLRQLLLFCYKASVTHDKATTEKAFQGFLEVNSSVGRFGADLARVSPRLLNRTRQHVQSVLYRFRPEAIVPGHGPGAVTTSKEAWLHRYDTIETIYPFSDWFCLQNRQHQERWDDLIHGEHIEAKLIAVPKDTRGPRLICVHPAESIWIQQGLRRELERSISVPRTSNGPWPSGHVHFDDQSVNGKIALLSSRSRRYATLDMKEASDRISEPLVQILFGRKYKYFGCCRAQKFRIPMLGTLRNLVGDIYSYAPMGNATTFPVQSLVFWAICVSSLQCRGFHQPGAVFVFGDDIIIPSECAQFVIDDLEAFGLLVNRTKSFWRGAFRESCGVDAFNGVDVTPVRWKTTIDAECVRDLQSLSDIAQRLRLAGYEEAATTTYSTLTSRLRAAAPMKRYIDMKTKRSMILKDHRFLNLPMTNNVNHGGIAEYTRCESQVWSNAKWHRNLQWYHTPVVRLDELPESRPFSDWNHVLESICLLRRTAHGEVPVRSLSRATRLNLGWTSVV